MYTFGFERVVCGLFSNTWSLSFRLQIGFDGGCKGFCGFGHTLEGLTGLPEPAREAIGG